MRQFMDEVFSRHRGLAWVGAINLAAAGDFEYWAIAFADGNPNRFGIFVAVGDQQGAGVRMNGADGGIGHEGVLAVPPKNPLVKDLASREASSGAIGKTMV